jgi:hypothetical protein
LSFLSVARILGADAGPIRGVADSGAEYYFKASETTIELSRNPLRIYGGGEPPGMDRREREPSGPGNPALDDEEIFP